MIKQPDWYITTNTPIFDQWTNLIFILAGLYAFSRNQINIGCILLLVTFGSWYYHQNPNHKTLMVDRLCMLVVFSFIYNQMDPTVSLITYYFLGILSLLWYHQFDDLTLYALYQILGGIIFYRSSYFANSWHYGLIYLISSLLQFFNYSYFHGIKHIGQGIALIGLISNMK